MVTLWLLSTDNLNRPAAELSPLLAIIEEVVTDLAAEGRWRLHPVGALDLLPAETARRLKEAAEATRDVDGMIVNIAVGYGGRREIADAVRSLLQEHASKGTSIEELAEILDVEHIAEHLYTKGQPDPDLVIRTSGEQRLGGFLLWQSAHSEFYFCEAYWPDFRRVDFLRAVRAYAERERRYGVLSGSEGGPDRVDERSPRILNLRSSPCGVSGRNGSAAGLLSTAMASGEARRFGRPVREQSRPSSTRRDPEVRTRTFGPIPVRQRHLTDRGASARAGPRGDEPWSQRLSSTSSAASPATSRRRPSPCPDRVTRCRAPAPTSSTPASCSPTPARSAGSTSTRWSCRWW